MIVTLTLNPAVDRTIFVPTLKAGQVHHVRESELDPAGKGINVSRIADRLGMATIAFGFLGGETGQIVARALQDEGVQSGFISVPGQTRLNVTVFDASTGQGTSFYDEGPIVDDEHLKILEREVEPWLRACQVLVLAGSLPLSVPADIYADYIKMARGVGTKTVLDSSDEPLRLGLKAGPYLVKPNVSEAERLVGRPLPDRDAIAAAAREILTMGAETVVISMGAEGAICVQGEHVWQAIPPPVKVHSTVGSGDSMVAGLAISISQGEDIVEGLRLGSAAGAATAMTHGTSLGTATDILRLLPQVRIESLTA